MPGAPVPTVDLIIPAYNEAETLSAFLQRLASVRELFGTIIVVDDCSTDQTSQIAQEFGVAVIRHRRNLGYGAAIKSGARASQAEFVLIMDCDGQHRPEEIPQLLKEIPENDMVVGERGGKSEDFDPRLPGKRVLHWVANFLAKQRIPDLNSGFRVARRQIIVDNLALLPDGFSFSTTLTLLLLKAHHEVKYVPVHSEVRRGGKSQVRFLRDGFNTFLLIIRTIMLFDPLRVFVPGSAALVGLGILYSIYDSLTKQRLNIPDGAVLVMIAGVVVFFFGLIADQISAMRRSLK
jgi:glycosyltransferase involved in cell wall biosynthesis